MENKIVLEVEPFDIVNLLLVGTIIQRLDNSNGELTSMLNSHKAILKEVQSKMTNELFEEMLIQVEINESLGYLPKDSNQ